MGKRGIGKLTKGDQITIVIKDEVVDGDELTGSCGFRRPATRGKLLGKILQQVDNIC